MKNAEDLIKAGKYLQAADAYQQALTTEPDNALAVIGRADAELGAGMYSSAANDLKFLFTKEPTLISVRHSLGDFIPASRQTFLETDLKSLTMNSGPGNNASFMLTYLYYNTGRMDQVKAELSRWDNRAWKDEWEGVLGRAWGK